MYVNANRDETSYLTWWTGNFICLQFFETDWVSINQQQKSLFVPEIYTRPIYYWSTNIKPLSEKSLEKELVWLKSYGNVYFGFSVKNSDCDYNLDAFFKGTDCDHQTVLTKVKRSQKIIYDGQRSQSTLLKANFYPRKAL